MSKEKLKVDTEANEKLKTQIDASIGATRSLIESWLPPPKPGEKLDNDDEDDNIMTKYSTGRPDRLGLGAKFLSHAEAMRHQNNQPSSSKEEMMLKNKILNQNKRANNNRYNSDHKRGKQEDSDSDDEEESRTTASKKSKIQSKQNNNTNNNNSNNNNNNNNNGKKKIGNQGDFLSMYLSERAGKKKGKKK